MQVEEFVLCMGYVVDFGYVLFEVGFVVDEVVVDQFVLLVVQEVVCVFVSLVWFEVVDYGFEVGEGVGCIGLDVSLLGFFCVWGEYLYWGFVGEDDVLLEQVVVQGIDQGLQLDIVSVDLLCQCGMCDSQFGVGEDFFLVVQW